MTTMRSAVVEDLAEQMRDEDGGAALLGEAAHELEQLLGHDGVQARGGLVEDDQPGRLIGDREGASDLDHLALRERQVADDGAGADAVPREDAVELVRDEARRPHGASAGRAGAGA